MKIGRISQSRHIEYEMQDALQQYIEKQMILKQAYPHFILENITHCARELHIPETGRIADFVLLSGSRLVNVEAKCYATQKLIDQLDDHAKYADYCFAYINDMTITPAWFKAELLQKGYGLIVYSVDHKIVTEVLEAHKNKNDKQARAEVVKLLKANSIIS